MKFTTAATASVLAALAAAEGSTRGCPGDVMNKIDVFAGSMTTLNEHIKEFDACDGLGSIPKLLEIQIGNMDLAQEVKATSDQVSQCEMWNDDDAADVSATLLTVIPEIKDTLQSIRDQKDQFDHALLGIASAGFIVEADLKLLKKNTDELGEGLKSHSPEWLVPAIEELLDEVSGWFDESIKLYENDPIFPDDTGFCENGGGNSGGSGGSDSGSGSDNGSGSGSDNGSGSGSGSDNGSGSDSGNGSSSGGSSGGQDEDCDCE